MTKPQEPRRLPKEIADSPVAMDLNSGEFISLREMARQARRGDGTLGHGAPATVKWLSDLEGEDLEKLVKKRLSTEPDREIGIMGEGTYTVKEILREVAEGTELGRDFLRVQKLYIADLRAKVESGHFDVS